MRFLNEKNASIVLFLATVISTTSMFGKFNRETFSSFHLFLEELTNGLRYSFPVLLILFSHEMGHYLTAKKFRVKTTPPFFLPAPNIFGTFGAIIFLKGRTPSRASLLYVGGMGPFLGFLVAIPVYLIGLSLSSVEPTSKGNLSLGDSLITLLLGHLMYPDIPEGYTIHLHPVGYAGWVGFFLTGLNMLPLGQLDGGHVVYSLSPRLFYFSSRLSMAFLIILSQFIWQFWLGLIILLLFFAFHHPSPEVWENPLPWKSRLFALLCLLIGIVTFVPKPLILS